MPLNWQEIEETLHRLMAAELQHIGTNYKKEPFYGLAFDCNTDYGEVLLSLNTPEGLLEKVEIALNRSDPDSKAWDKWSDDFSRRLQEQHGLPPAPPKAKPTREEYERDYRWSLGDWKFMGVQSEAFESAWEPMRDAIESAALEDSAAISEAFMEMACRVAVRLEREELLIRLPRTDDFKTLVCNHDESLDAAETRLSRIRASFPATKQG